MGVVDLSDANHVFSNRCTASFLFFLRRRLTVKFSVPAELASCHRLYPLFLFLFSPRASRENGCARRGQYSSQPAAMSPLERLRRWPRARTKCARQPTQRA